LLLLLFTGDLLLFVLVAASRLLLRLLLCLHSASKHKVSSVCLHC
jgi:hypothetical protein